MRGNVFDRNPFDRQKLAVEADFLTKINSISSVTVCQFILLLGQFSVCGVFVFGEKVIRKVFLLKSFRAALL